jgi:hypothetical protein
MHVVVSVRVYDDESFKFNGSHEVTISGVDVDEAASMSINCIANTTRKAFEKLEESKKKAEQADDAEVSAGVGV